MFFRFSLALCLVALFAVAINAEEQTPDVVDGSEVENRSIQGKAVAKIIGKIAAGMAASCVFEAGEHCKSHWKNPGKAISCAKNFFKANKGRCAAGK